MAAWAGDAARRAGGGSRVSAATVVAGWTEGDIAAAEAEMGARPLFMLREGEERLDAFLAARGYVVMDPVVGYVAPVGVLATERPPPVTTFEVWPVLAAQREIWAGGHRACADCGDGTGEGAEGFPPRAVGRQSGGCSFCCGASRAWDGSRAGGPAAVPAAGIGAHLIRAAAFWAAGQGAEAVGLVVTEANAGARALYEGMGMQVAARYHYRVRAA